VACLQGGFSTPSTSAKAPKPLPLRGGFSTPSTSARCSPRPLPLPGGFSTPSTSAKAPRPLPLLGEGREEVGSVCGSGVFSVVRVLYPIDLGQSPEATSPGRGKKEAPSTSARCSPRPLPQGGEGREEVGSVFAWRVSAPGRVSTPSTSARSSPRPLPQRGEGRDPRGYRVAYCGVSRTEASPVPNSHPDTPPIGCGSRVSRSTSPA